MSLSNKGRNHPVSMYLGLSKPPFESLIFFLGLPGPLGESVLKLKKYVQNTECNFYYLKYEAHESSTGQ